METETWRQRTYYARKELGICVNCGMDVEEPGKFVMCAACREKQRQRNDTDEMRTWRRKYQREYRAMDAKRVLERIAIEVRKLTSNNGDLRSARKDIPKDHKCWDCVWSRHHGDRFFCPLVGCVKGPMKQEAAIVQNKTSEY